MLFPLRERLERLPHREIALTSVYVFVVFASLWRGGKGLEATWLLTGLAWFVTYLYWEMRPRGSHVPTSLWVLGLLFMAWTFISYHFSTTANYGFDELLQTASLLVMFFWAYRMLSEGSAWETFSRVVRITLLVACGIGVIVYIVQPVNRFVGPFFDMRFHTDYWPNAWADYLLLTWPFVGYWALQERDFIRSLVKLGTLSFVLGCFLASYSRGALIAFSGQVVLWSGVLYLHHKRVVSWKDIAQKVLFVALLSALVFAACNRFRSELFEVQSVTEKVTFTAAEGTSSSSERRSFWVQALTLANERPLYGWGPYSFRFVQPQFQTEVFATSDHPHNVFLKIAMERGWPALILFVSFLGVIAWRVRKTSLSKLASGRTLVILVSIAGLIAHSLIDYNLQFVSVSLLLWLLLGVLVADLSWPKDIEIDLRIIRFAEILLVTVLLVFAVFEAKSIVLSSFGRHAEARGDAVQALQWYDASAKQLFSRDLHLSRSKLFDELGAYDQAYNALEKYFAVNEQDYRVWKWLGEVELDRDNPEAALTAFRAAYQRGRYDDIGITTAFVDTLILTKQFDELESRKEEFDTLMMAYMHAIERNAHFIGLSQNVEMLLELTNTFAYLFPDEAPMYIVMGARADHNARLERERLRSRPPGFLW